MKRQLGIRITCEPDKELSDLVHQMFHKLFGTNLSMPAFRRSNSKEHLPDVFFGYGIISLSEEDIRRFLDTP